MLINAPIRGQDSQGSGAYGAPRGGDRKHKGEDVACYKGSEVLSPTVGKVTKIGYPYDPANSKKGHLRYVQVSHAGYNFRYFYVHPSVDVGDVVAVGDILGVTQGLMDIYPGITDHYHFEIKVGAKHIANPVDYLKDNLNRFIT